MFDDKIERKPPPRKFSNEGIIRQLRDVINGLLGKHEKYGGIKRKRGLEEANQKKKSIFFELEYWSLLQLRHNIDVMHVKKNVCDSLLRMILD